MYNLCIGLFSTFCVYHTQKREHFIKIFINIVEVCILSKFYTPVFPFLAFDLLKKKTVYCLSDIINVNWESFKTLAWAFLPNRLKQLPMISQLDLPSTPDTIHAMITQFLQWELTGVLWPNNSYVTSYTLCYHSFIAMHCLWKEILSQQRIRHFKNLQSVYFAYDVGIISSYSNRILIQIKSLFKLIQI